MIFFKKCIFTALSLVFLSAYANSELPNDDYMPINDDYMPITVPKHIRMINMIENTHSSKKKLILSVMLEFTLDRLEEEQKKDLYFYDLYGATFGEEQSIHTEEAIRKCKSVIDKIKVWRKKYCYEIWKD